MERRTPRLAWAATIVVAVMAFDVSMARADEGPCEKGRSVDSKKIFDGITLIEESCDEPLYHAYVIKMDLDEPGYRLVVTPYAKRRRTTSEFADMTGAILAINGGFWGGEWGGFTVAGGEVWPKDAQDLDTSTVVGFGERAGDGRLKVDIRPTEEQLDQPLPWMKEALTGIPLLLEGGKVVDVQNEHTLFSHKHPRTALGLSKDSSTLVLVVVDGRQPGWSKGLRTGQLSLLLLSHGAHRALNLDGGASSTLVIPSLGGLVNKPCHKKAPERSVPNHLGILRVNGKSAALVDRLLGPLAAVLS